MPRCRSFAIFPPCDLVNVDLGRLWNLTERYKIARCIVKARPEFGFFNHKERKGHKVKGGNGRPFFVSDRLTSNNAKGSQLVSIAKWAGFKLALTSPNSFFAYFAFFAVNISDSESLVAAPPR